MQGMQAALTTGRSLLVALIFFGTSAISTLGFQQTPARDPRPVSTNPGTASIVGRVATSSGQTLARAQVFLTSSTNQSWRTTTDSSGQFQFAALPAGTYKLSVSHPQYLVSEFGQTYVDHPGRAIDLTPNEVFRADLVAIRGGSITGRVSDELGHPMSEVAVTAYRLAHDGRSQQLVPVASTSYRSNDIGEYRIARLPPGDYYISAQPSARSGIDGAGSQGFAPTWFPGALNASGARSIRVLAERDVTNVDFQLQLVSFTSITGTISAPSGVRVDEARIQLLPADSFFSVLTPIRSGVDRTGNFRIERIPPGDYVLTAAAGFEPEWSTTSKNFQQRRHYYARIPLTIVAEPVANLAVNLVAAPMISGRIEADSGWPVSSQLTVSASPLVGSMGPGSYGVVNDRGHFALQSGPGIVRLSVSGLPAGWFVERVSSGGRDITGSGLRIEAADVADVSILITSRTAELSGTVVSSSPGRVEYTVVAISVDPSLRSSASGGVRTARPDQHGMFSMKGLRAGNYFVVALDYVAPNQLYDPRLWQQIESLGERLTLSKGESRPVSLRLATLNR